MIEMVKRTLMLEAMDGCGFVILS